ncbi:hypothetical protein, partial [Escherichia coli]|uniref:hypothetical protein n=1 Tax=Escherichia coli TaxID=562 RepID=UPI001CDAD3C0
CGEDITFNQVAKFTVPLQTPVGMTDAFLTLFPVIVGLPRYCGVSAPSTAFRWLLSVHSRYGPHNPLTS